jgi:predicted deacetylase
MYLIRLDDASEYMDVEKWAKVEELLDKYHIKPIVGIIPNNKDKELVNKYKFNPLFWETAREWQTKKWTIALHGYTHVYCSNSGGVNPVNFQSEFADIPLGKQKEKISNGIRIFKKHGLIARVFFAPSHTFDMNTLEALRQETDIRIISDTIANDIYKYDGFYFIPQQSGKVRKLPFKVTTFCYHPNTMKEEDFITLENFLIKYKREFGSFADLNFNGKNPSLYDKILRSVYFSYRKIRTII